MTSNMPGLAFIDGGDPIAVSGTNLYRVSLTGNTNTVVGSTTASITDLAAYAKFADVAITKTSGTSIFIRNTNGTYNLAVRNNGPMSASGPFTVSDTLPANLTFVSGTGTGWSCSAAGQVVTCTNNTASLAAGGSLAVMEGSCVDSRDRSPRRTPPLACSWGSCSCC